MSSLWPDKVPEPDGTERCVCCGQGSTLSNQLHILPAASDGSSFHPKMVHASCLHRKAGEESCLAENVASDKKRHGVARCGFCGQIEDRQEPRRLLTGIFHGDRTVFICASCAERRF